MTEHLSQPPEQCPVCGCNLRDGALLRPCPVGPHHEDEYPGGAA